MTEKNRQSKIQPEQTQGFHPPPEDEINLADLLEVLVRKKVLILAIMSICTLISIFYAQSTTPIYRATMAFVEPQETFFSTLPLEVIENLPLSRSALSNKKGEPTGVNPSAFLMFLAKVGSYELKKEVLVKGGFLEKFFGDARVDTDQAVLEIHNSTKIIKPTGPAQAAHVEIVGPKPEVLAEFLTALTKSALKITVKEIKSLVQTEINSEINKLSLKIDIEKERRKKEISILSEALNIAKNLGIKNNNFRFYNGEHLSDGKNWPLWYLYGEKALQQEIMKRKLRKNWDAVLGLTKAETALRKYQAIDISPLKIKVANISQPSIPSVKPIKPEKTKIIAIGMALGLLISIFMAFLINAIEQLKTKETPSASTREINDS